MRNNFIKYIENNSSAPNSVKNYTSGLNAIFKIIGRDLFNITSSQEISNIIEELNYNQDFLNLNKNNKMYSNAIRHYFEFLDSQKDVTQNAPILNEIQIQLTKELLKTVVELEPNVTYKDLAKRVTDAGLPLHHRQVGRNIGEISKLCFNLGLPLLSAKVMNQSSHAPGEGFLDLYKSLDPTIKGDPKYLFKKELEKIRKCENWYILTEQLGIEVEGIKRPENKDIKKQNNKLDKMFLQIYESVFPEEVHNEKYSEGSVKSVLVNKYERNPAAKRKCIEHYGTKCQICGFKFSDKYGEIFENKIHVHHIKPLSEIGEEYEINPIADLIPVCPNCHIVLHSKGKNEVYSIDEVRKMIVENS